MTYAIAYQGRGLASFCKKARYGTVKDMIRFSTRDYQRFESEERAQAYT